MTDLIKEPKMPPSKSRRHNPHFLARSDDGTARVRMKFEGDEAALMEEAAGGGDVVKWMHKTLQDGARRDVAAQRAQRPAFPPPNPA